LGFNRGKYRDPSINEKVSCTHDYRLTANRSFEGEQTGTGPVLVPVATKGMLIEVEFVARRTGDLWTLNFEPFPTSSPSIETVLKIWNAPNIESLYGTHFYYCDEPGDSQVDTLDEIANRRTNLLTAAEQKSFDPFSESEFNKLAWADGDGDGTMCDGDETDTDGDGRSITRIILSVYPSDG